MEFKILGPLEVEQDGRVVVLGGSRERVLLARLLISANLVVSTDRLAEDLWSAKPPAHWLPTLRVYIWRLRQALGANAAALGTEPPGYRLSLTAGQLDAEAFDLLTAAARRDLADGQPEAAAATLRRALGLWRGAALSDVADLPFARADAARLDEARLAAIEDRVEADLGCGQHAIVTAELDGLITSYPLRERLWRQRMLALYRCGRQAEALRTYRELRAFLGEELGIEPCTDLRELESAILRQDPALAWHAPRSATSSTPPVLPPAEVPVRPAGPPQASSPAARLPAQTTSFIGREAELAEIGTLLTATRLLTLTGPSGCGKTRLAREVGALAAARRADGVWLVDLAPVVAAELVAPAVAAVLAVREAPDRPLAESIATRLNDGNALLIIDNCEHVADAAAELIAALLAACPALRILATSQVKLAVPGESGWPVPPLSVPPPSARDPAVVAEAESVRLLCDRTALNQPGFRLTSANAEAIGEICRRLDGIPLAIELAAARLNTLTPTQLAARLDDRFRLLTGGSRTDLARHRTLRAAISWSHDLLDQPEQVCFRRMAIFAGGCTLDAAEAVCTDASLPTDRVLEAVAALVDRSLLTTQERCGSMRYGMLESIRQYAREQLVQAREEEQLSHRHLAWLLDLASEADLEGADQTAWMDLLEADHDNFRAGIEWALAAGRADSALALTGDLAAFWVVRGYVGEGRRWLSAALGLAAVHDPRSRATALDGAGQLAFAHADYPAEWDYLQESLGIWREVREAARVAQCLFELGTVAHIRGDFRAARPLLDEALVSARLAKDQRQIAMALSGLGRLAMYQDDLPRAALCLEESLACFHQVGDLRRVTFVVGNLALVARNQGRIDLAQARMEEQLANARELGDRKLVGWALTNLGMIAIETGDLAAARPLQDEALRLAEEIGDRRVESYALAHLGLLCQANGDYPAARSYHQRSLRLAQALSEPRSIADNLEELAGIDAAEGSADLAARILGAAQALRERANEPVTGPDLSRYNDLIGRVRQALSDEQFQVAWDSGRSMSERQAITLAAPAPGERLPI